MSAAKSIRARSWVAIIAAYALVLQGLFGAALSGQSLAPALLDRAAHLTLCAPGGEGVPLPGEEPAPHLPACCLLGCAWIGAAYAPPDRPALLGEVEAGVTIVGFDDLTGRPLPGQERLAARPRGPPVRA
ncbi:conserved hypothetical protein [Bosea sp. 62]|uniref:hypothetical protein n=1 Tax=unclassified Bosea (in: a-proteobacteria) TaxID=2653178 RepID=UPI0012513334|nr:MULTISPECIES: hypothetical protein [unclassified Bosea (in: a-proteobacteria)]CAD5263544.1 conserved hypothetical protein [Bosea sp. 46]CAD5265870.1 conserved hypothetical protein [Bosea sp. 21B]CAD5273891.1 conserved hypothetical protein [Bosea sp. 7B]VVT56675.1 conserved hypothetical protein [Bosea sp. EC-HK365B]VXB77563.1 conserved hypothetical protein [Bosea sp. 29B]